MKAIVKDSGLEMKATVIQVIQKAPVFNHGIVRIKNRLNHFYISVV